MLIAPVAIRTITVSIAKFGKVVLDSTKASPYFATILPTHGYKMWSNEVGISVEWATRFLILQPQGGYLPTRQAGQYESLDQSFVVLRVVLQPN